MSIATLMETAELLQLFHAADWSLGQFRKLVELGQQKGRLQERLEDGTLSELLEVSGDLNRGELRQFLKLESLYPDLTELVGIVIPEDATVDTLKSADAFDSESDYAKQHFTSGNFNVTVHGPRNVSLAHFKKNVTSEHVEAVAKKMGYEVALVEDLLCFGAHPEHCKLQEQFPILALGSATVLGRSLDVPCLDKFYDIQSLDLFCCHSVWGDVM